MRRWILPFAALCGFALGCNKSPEGGTGAGSDKPAGSGYKISLPTDVSALHTAKQGAAESYDGSIDRASDFKKDVKLKVEAPAKIEAKLNKDVIKASDGDTKFTITVTPAKDAPIGEHEIKVTGTSDGGNPTAGSFKVKVTAP